MHDNQSIIKAGRNGWPLRPPIITAAQCRMARGALGWSLRKLQDKSGVSYVTIQKFEKGGVMFWRTSCKVANALKASGRIKFTGKDTVRFIG